MMDGGMRQAVAMTALFAALLAASGCAVRSTVGAHAQEPALPMRAEERSEVCATYAERLDWTRSQLQRRNAFGRLDMLRAEHRAMERFVEDHCAEDHG